MHRKQDCIFPLSSSQGQRKAFAATKQQIGIPVKNVSWINKEERPWIRDVLWQVQDGPEK